MARDEVVERRLRRTEETKAAIAQVRANRTPGNVAALHRLHARHLREDGYLDAAAEAEERAKRAEGALGERGE